MRLLTQYWWEIAISMVALLGTTIRLWKLDQHRIWLDEAFVAVAALRSPSHIWFELPKVEAHPPLFFLIEHWVTRWFGYGPLALRLVSAILGSLLVPISAMVLRRWLGELPSLVAAFGMALNPFLVWHAQDARMYSLLAVEFATSIYAIDRAVDARDVRRQVAWIAVAAAIALCALFTHYLGMLLPPIEFGVLMARAGMRQRVLRYWLAMLGVVFVTWVPWVVYWGALPSAAYRPESGVGLWEPFRTLAARFSAGKALEFASFPIDWPATVTLALAGWGWVWLARHWHSRTHCALGIWAGVGVAAFLALAWMTGVPWDKSYLLAAPALFGVLVAPLGTVTRWRWPAAGLLSVWFIVVAITGLPPYLDRGR